MDDGNEREARLEVMRVKFVERGLMLQFRCSELMTATLKLGTWYFLRVSDSASLERF